MSGLLNKSRWPAKRCGGGDLGFITHPRDGSPARRDETRLSLLWSINFRKTKMIYSGQTRLGKCYDFATGGGGVLNGVLQGPGLGSIALNSMGSGGENC